MSIRSGLSIIVATARMRIMMISRYPAELLIDILTPIVFAAMPILLGRATAGEQAETIFTQNTGTGEYAAYMLIGSGVFSIVFYAFWNIAYWLRWEMETGTIEALYLSPTHRVWVAAGTAAYSLTRGIFSATTAYFLGSVILGADPLRGDLLLAVAFIAVGLIPLFGMTLLFGATVLKVKQANALVNLMHWVVSFLMGVFFPIAMFPPLLRVLSLLFPPTWMTNGVRAALLGIGFFFKTWYLDLAVLWVAMVIGPLIGYWALRRVETEIRRNEGIGVF
jgi:ABC-2 type transport system permease protein